MNWIILYFLVSLISFIALSGFIVGRQGFSAGLVMLMLISVLLLFVSLGVAL